MANTTTHGRGTLTITGLDADWLYTTGGGFNADVGMKLQSITFKPSTVNDVMVIHDGSIDGAVIFDSGTTAGDDPLVKYYDGTWRRPVIDISDCTLGTAANAAVMIDYL